MFEIFNTLLAFFKEAYLKKSGQEEIKGKDHLMPLMIVLCSLSVGMVLNSTGVLSDDKDDKKSGDSSGLAMYLSKENHDKLTAENKELTNIIHGYSIEVIELKQRIKELEKKLEQKQTNDNNTYHDRLEDLYDE